MRKYAVVIIVFMLLLLVSMRNNKYKYWSYYIRRKWIVFWRKTVQLLKRALSSFRGQNYIMDDSDKRNEHHYEEGR
ncbi:hypothetical protein GCM10007216_01700 [Thalassobacillus devorans]|uniref:Uncharacterized protein n=1 Tax=Thalassobacillus devorans TaxID=279813 RepID=A0ABQ1NEP3_9BACI|nr:hypothetical protein [Thalassobacillus devorans]GGC74764.1 hypothetical protein GCM10007216_01700 [Thalassobacillus devorans]